MVDINLFEEEPEEQDDLGDGLGGDAFSGDDLGGDDDFSGDLNLDDGLSDDDGFGEDDLLDNEDSIPDFEESEDEAEDYAFEGSSKRGSFPPWLLFLIGGAVIVVLLIQFVLPMLFSPKPVPVKQQQNRVVRPQTQPPPAGATQNQTQTQAPRGGETMQSKPTSTQVGESTLTPNAALIDQSGQFDVLASTRSVFENLSRQGQAGVVIINGDNFLVEYVSATPGVSKAMGNQISQQIGANNFDASPEEKHSTGGRENYWGVISGIMPDPKVYGQSGKFANVTSFQNQVSALIKQNGYVLKSIEQPAGRSSVKGWQISGHMIFEGPQKNLAAFLTALNQMQGQWGISKLLLAPLNISDFHATQVKVGITFWVVVG